jgi:hypothetical protein
LINGLKYEKAAHSPTFDFLLERCDDEAIRSKLYWGLAVASEDEKYRKHFRAFLFKFGTCKHVSGEFLDEQERVADLAECLKSFPNDSAKITGLVRARLLGMLKTYEGVKYVS